MAKVVLVSGPSAERLLHAFKQRTAGDSSDPPGHCPGIAGKMWTGSPGLLSKQEPPIEQPGDLHAAALGAGARGRRVRTAVEVEDGEQSLGAIRNHF